MTSSADGERVLESSEVLFEFGDGTDPDPDLAPCRAEPVGDMAYRLLEQPLSYQAKFDDIVRAEACDDGTLKFQSILKKARTIPLEFVLSQAVVDSAEFQAYCRGLSERGIHWERMCVGIFVCFPPWREAKAVRRHLEAIFKTHSPPEKPTSFWERLRGMLSRREPG